MSSLVAKWLEGLPLLERASEQIRWEAPKVKPCSLTAMFRLMGATAARYREMSGRTVRRFYSGT